MIKRLIAKACNRQNLSISEAYQALNSFTSGDATDAQIAALLLALKMKGETVEELTGFACALKDKAQKVEYNSNPIFDCCGTGGDMASTINVSTTAAILAAAGGVYIAKHSNKSITSLSGSSDVIQELGIHLCVNEKEVYYHLDNNNIAFLHAPSFHTATKNVAQIRKDLGVKTIFNLLGPLSNPAALDGQLLGVNSPELCPVVAEVLRNIKIKKALVVCALKPRLDELSICSETLIYEINGETIKHYEISPEDFGLTRTSIDKIKGSDPRSNARVISDIFETKINDARKDIVLLNAAAIFLISNKVETLKEGVNMASSILKTGKAYEKLLLLNASNN